MSLQVAESKALNGALIVDKPAGLTSHDVVARCRRLLGERSIGHLGTLDPEATGVLPLLVGRLTRLAQYFQARDKEYEGEIRFGFATTTYDAAGEPVGEPQAVTFDRAALEAAMARFRGRIQQRPPAFSAKKIAGVRAYERARRCESVELAPVDVEVFAFELIDFSGARARVQVRCSTGTYVRSLAHDLGEALGVGGHLSALRRTRVGEFRIEQAVTLERLAQMAEAADAAAALLSPRALLPELPAVTAPPEAVAKLIQGRAANLPDFSTAAQVRVFTAQGRLLAIGSRIAGTLFHPKLVFRD